MSHSPPVPPGNQSPYPMAEAPHARSETGNGVPAASDPSVDRAASERSIRTGIAAALGIGAIAALVAGIVAARQHPPARPAPKRKSKGPGKKKR